MNDEVNISHIAASVELHNNLISWVSLINTRGSCNQSKENVSSLVTDYLLVTLKKKTVFPVNIFVQISLGGNCFKTRIN